MSEEREKGKKMHKLEMCETLNLLVNENIAVFSFFLGLYTFFPTGLCQD